MAKKKDAPKDENELLENPDAPKTHEDQEALNKIKDVGDSGDRGSSRADSPDDYGPTHGSGGPGVAVDPGEDLSAPVTKK